MTACDDCLRRTWLVARLAGHIDVARRGRRAGLALLLALDDGSLMDAVAAPRSVHAEYAAFAPARARATVGAAGLAALCRHDAHYPAALRDLPDAPAALHVAGDPARFAELTHEDRPAVAIVGARRATPYGTEVAFALGRGLAAADVVVVSGLALGVDACAHAGALEVQGPTIAVLAASADRPYPSSKRRVYAAVRAHGSVVSEMPPGFEARTWSFPARNRIIAGLSRLTVVVEAAERSGSLITAEMARDIGREVGAVPGRVTSPMSAGTNALLHDGAAVVRSASDALDLACGAGAWHERDRREQVPDRLRPLFDAVADGHDTPGALVALGHAPGAAMAALSELELLGRVRCTPGGHWAVVP